MTEVRVVPSLPALAFSLLFRFQGAEALHAEVPRTLSEQLALC
jgi:hypothetical protein